MAIFQVQARQGGSPLLDAIQGGLATADKIYGLKAQQAQMDKYQKDSERADAEYQRAEAIRAEENDPDSPLLKSFRDRAAKVGMKVPDGVTIAQVKREPGFLEEFSTRLKAAEERRGEAAKRSGKEETAGVTVPGFGITPGAKPTKEDASTMKGLNESQIAIKANLDKLRALVKEHGGEVAPGPVKDQMEGIVGELKLQLKDAAKLGQITSADMELIEAQVPVTTGLAAKFGGGERLMSKIQNFEDSVRGKLDAAAKARGFQQNQGGEQKTAGPPGQNIIEGAPDPAIQAAAQKKLQERMAARKGQSNPIVKR